MNNNDRTVEESVTEPLLRPFEVVAIACGVLTLVATFLVNAPLIKGLLIAGSLFGLLAALAYYGISGVRERARHARGSVPRSAMKSMSLPF